MNDNLNNLDATGHSVPEIIFHRDDVAGSSAGLHQNRPRKKRRYTLSILNPKPLKTTTKARPKNDVVSAPRPCTECGKKFFSKKALYGHMRCHPERHWRGINPPAASAAAVVADEYEIATCLLLLADGERNNVVFECSSCKKVFRSHQALGGHRASHKNVKGCFAMAAQSLDDWACGPSSSSAHGLRFDLNLPAVDQDECCYSSSLSTCDDLDLRLGL